MSEPRKREFFIDRHLGRQFPATLTVAGFTVHRHDEHFAQDCPDEEWLTVVGRRGWVAITFDHRIRYKPNELSAAMAASVTLLVLVGKATFLEHALSFIKSVPIVLALLDKHVPLRVRSRLLQTFAHFLTSSWGGVNGVLATGADGRCFEHRGVRQRYTTCRKWGSCQQPRSA